MVRDRRVDEVDRTITERTIRSNRMEGENVEVVRRIDHDLAGRTIAGGVAAEQNGASAARISPTTETAIVAGKLSGDLGSVDVPNRPSSCLDHQNRGRRAVEDRQDLGL